MNSLEHLRNVFVADRYATDLTGISIDKADSNGVVCSVKITDSHRNALGAVMGGVIFTLADLAFAVAANLDAITDSPIESPVLHWVSTSSNIHFLTAAKGEMLTASTHCIRHGNRQCLFQIEITDSLGRNVALAITEGMKIDK